MNNIEEGILGEFVEALGSRRSGSMANVHVERLAAAWANEPAPRLVEEAIPRRLVEFDRVDRVGRHAASVVEERDLATRHDRGEGPRLGIDRRRRLPGTDGTRMIGHGPAVTAALADVDRR